MPKKVLEIKDFTGGLNCFSDARDIKDSEFAQLWNANTSQTGLMKFGGSLVQNIIGLIHSNTNFQEGYGLFATGVDYSFNIIDGDFETPFEQGAIAGYASGTPSITLAANSTYQSKTNHDTANFYRNYAILIYSTADGNAPQGETRRITAYAADTHVATLDAAFSASPLTDGTEYYKIFKWIGDGVNFGNSGSTDYIDKSGSDFPYDDISSHNLDDSMNSYFLRTKVSSITDTQSKNLGFVTYNPSTAIDDTGAVATGEGAAFSEDSTTIGATTLKSGVEYTLSFFCKLNTRYFGYVSNTSYAERAPFVQIYSDSVRKADGSSTGLYLFQSDTGPTFMHGSDGTYDYADDITKQYVANGDFEAGTATGGDGGQSGTYDPPTSWLAYDGWIAHINNAITYSYISDADSFGSDTTGSGGTLQMVAGSAFLLAMASGTTPNCYMYQDITLEDNQWYELSFVYASASAYVGFSITDTFSLTNTAVRAAEAQSASDGAVTLAVDNGAGGDSVATTNLLANKELYKSDGTFFGVCTAVTDAQNIVFTGGLAGAIADDDLLYTASLIKQYNFPALEPTGGDTVYRYVGQNSGYADDKDNNHADGDYPKPYKFFVPDNSGTPRVIRIAFAPLTSGASTIRLDGIAVRKSFPDLLSIASKMGIADPYTSASTSWQRYQMKFRIPQEYGDSADWVVRLHAGTWGFQNGAAESVDNHTVYFDSITLESNEMDNLIFLNDNTTTSSSIKIYSDNYERWGQTYLKWSGIDMKPVYNYVNGILKVSDANFNSGNKSKIFYHLKRKILGNFDIEGYRYRDLPISEPPELLVSAGGDAGEIVQTFKALNYIQEYTYASFHQWSGDATLTELDWPLDDLINTGRVIHYYHGDNDQYTDFILTQEGGSTNELDDAKGYAGPAVDGPANTVPFYLAWAGQDGTDNDMGGTMASYTTGSISRVVFECTIDWQSNFRGSTITIENHACPSYPEVQIGKMGQTDIFTSGAPSTANKKLLATGDSTVCSLANQQSAVFYDPANDDDILDFESEFDMNVAWGNSLIWPWSTVHSEIGGNILSSSKTFKGVVSFDKDEVAITDDMIMEFKTKHNSIDAAGSENFRSTLLYEEDAQNWARWERVKFNYIDVYFRSTNWTAAGDGFTSSDTNRTKVNFSFASPSGATAVGWEERIYNLAVSSVNVFDEESNLNIVDETIGGTLSGSSSTNTSSITAGQSPNVTIYVGKNVARDDFRSKLKYYMKDTDSNIWYLQFYVDLNKNKAYSTTSNYSTTGVFSNSNKSYSYDIPREKVLNYNEIDSYESQTLVKQDLTLNELICDYKTAVVANNRLYVGNIRQNGNVYGDRMIKSPIGKYNLLPSSNFIDVAINDGDEITALEFFKDKLLQFKKRKVFVINTSGDYEFLEDTFNDVGVLAPYQVTKTPYGIAWANKQGLFLYDGKSLSNLLDKKIPNNKTDELITDNWWQIESTSAGVYSDDIQYTASVAYDAKQKDIIVKRGIEGGAAEDSEAQGDGYIYNLVTKSWYFTHRAFNGISKNEYQNAMSNFATDKNGDVISYNLQTTTSDTYAINDIMKWQHTEGNDEAMCNQQGITGSNVNQKLFYFTTADFTFGDITRRKKIYKVYITYKSVNSSGSSTNSMILVQHATNGGTSFTAFDDSSTNYAAATGLTGSTTWATAILTPSSSINNVYSMQLRFLAVTTLTAGFPAPGFKINDISIVYRDKPIK